MNLTNKFYKCILFYLMTFILIITINSCNDANGSSTVSTGSNIAGILYRLANEKIELIGFEGFDTYVIDSTIIKTDGGFRLNFEKSDFGIGLLQSPADPMPLIVVLDEEGLILKGEALSYNETIKIIEGKENQWFVQYAIEQPKREQALSAWFFLETMYTMDSLFSEQKEAIKAIEHEKIRLQNEESFFLNSLPQDSYVRWFLPIRKLVSSVSAVAQYRVDEIPTTTKALRDINYTDERLLKSGLFRESLKNHVWFIENSAESLEKVFQELNVSIDIIIDQLRHDPQLFSEVTDYLFNLLEERSLFNSAEFLALKVLRDEGCTIEDNVAKKLETYRRMKIGNTAPDLVFSGKILAKEQLQENVPQRLSEIQSPYTLVVFAAGWCPMCISEIAEISALYRKWKLEGIEVIMISLDYCEEAFLQVANELPFLSVCDFKGWDSPMAENYYVFGTPTMYLLDEKRDILLRPNSAKHMDAWVDWVLLKKDEY